MTARTMFERADREGGVWEANTYPGAACDIPATLYSFSFAPKADWTRRYPPQGTGFRATDFLTPMTVTGLDGRDLHETWRDGAEAHLGIEVAGFPNLFLLYGPNTNLGHNSIVYMLESQIGHVLRAVRWLARRGGGSLEVRPEVQRRFADRCSSG